MREKKDRKISNTVTPSREGKELFSFSAKQEKAKVLVRGRHHVDGGRAPVSPNDDSFHPVMWRAKRCSRVQVPNV